MQKVFFRNLIFLVSLNVLIKPLWILGIDRTVQNVVGSSSYGIYFVLFNMSMLTQILLDVGISNYNNRYLAQNENELTGHLSNIFSIKIILSGLYVTFTLIIGYFIHYDNYQLFLLAMICINQALASLIVYSRSNISALHHFRVDSMLSVMDKALMIVICGVLLFVPALKSGFRIEWFIYAQTAAYVITLVIALFYIMRLSGLFRFHFSATFALQLFKRSFPFALLIMLMAIYSRVDGVMIEKLLPGTGAHEAGIYASAYRLLDALNQFGYLFAVLLLPIFSRMFSRKQDINALVKTSFTAIFIFSFIVCLALSFFSYPIMKALYHEATPYSARILSTLIYSFVGTATVYIFGTLLTANGNLRELIAISLIAVILNFTMNLFLIPLYRAYGAAFAACITNLTIGGLNLLLSLRFFRFKPNYPLLLRLAIFAAGSFALFCTQSLWNINWIVLVLLFGSISLLFAFMLGLIQIRKTINLFKPETVIV